MAIVLGLSVSAAATPVTVTETASGGSAQAGDAPSGGYGFGRGAGRAGPVSERAGPGTMASLHLDTGGFSTRFSDPAGDPSIRLDGPGSVVEGLGREGPVRSQLDAMIPPDAFAIALVHPSEIAVSSALDLLQERDALELRKAAPLLDFDGDMLFGEVPSFASMPLPAPLLLLLSAIGWLALGARGRAAC